MWHNMYGATYSSHAGHTAKNGNGLAKAPGTSYQAMFRSSSYQSCTRGRIKPTWMTNSLTVKGLFGQWVVQGFVPAMSTARPVPPARRWCGIHPGGKGGSGSW